MRTALTALACLLLLAFAPQGDERGAALLSPPLAGGLALSGTFGELRPGHFHGGIDLKGAVGQPVLAAAGGYVWRIGVSADGYGKVLYLRHPDGFVTLYAHLDRFRPELEDYVRSIQYARESFEADIYPARGRFAYEAGETLGYIGMSGRTYGPHLHFELRRGEQAFNPLRYGIAAADRRPPTLQALRLHELGTGQAELLSRAFELRKSGQAYRLRGGDTLYTDAPYAALSLLAYDQLDRAENRNGLYGMELWVDDSLAFRFRMDSFGLRQARYLNAHIDYAAQAEEGLFFNRAHRLPGNDVGIYGPDGGRLALPPGGAAKLRFAAYDLAGNSAVLECWLKRRAASDTASALAPLYGYRLPHDEASIIREASLEARFPENSFYEEVFLAYQAVSEESFNVYSLVHQLHDGRLPVHRPFTLAIRPNRPIPEPLREKAFIAYCDARHEIVNCGGQWRDGWLHAQASALGDYCIMLDTVPPRIEPLLFQEDMRGKSGFAFRIADNFSAASRTPGLRYRAAIDGRWALFSYDRKNGRLDHRFEGKLSPGRHQLRLEVWDAVGNAAVFEAAFEI